MNLRCEERTKDPRFLADIVYTRAASALWPIVLASRQLNHLSFDLFGRIDDPGSAAAIAQHYGLPSSFVDFTFDPRIAVWFACLESPSEAVPDVPPGLSNCAVVYFTSFPSWSTS